MPCVVNDYGATCVASKNPELFFSQKINVYLAPNSIILQNSQLFTVKTLKIGTPRLTTIVVLNIKQFDFTMQ